MPVMNFGETMKGSYMETWRPAPGSINVISILSLNPIGTKSHWVDAGGVKDRCQCVDGICCKAFGPSYLTYYFPIIVYKAMGSTEGTLYAWGVTTTQYKTLCSLAAAGNLLEFDVQVQAVQQGQGVQTSFTLMPSSRLRDLMNDSQKADLENFVADFYKSESVLCRPMTPEAYNQLLISVNYDFKSGLPLPKPQQMQTPAAGYYPNGIPQMGAPMGAQMSLGAPAVPAPIQDPKVLEAVALGSPAVPFPIGKQPMQMAQAAISAPQQIAPQMTQTIQAAPETVQATPVASQPTQPNPAFAQATPQPAAQPVAQTAPAQVVQTASPAQPQVTTQMPQTTAGAPNTVPGAQPTVLSPDELRSMLQ